MRGHISTRPYTFCGAAAPLTAGRSTQLSVTHESSRFETHASSMSRNFGRTGSARANGCSSRLETQRAAGPECSSRITWLSPLREHAISALAVFERLESTDHRSVRSSEATRHLSLIHISEPTRLL